VPRARNRGRASAIPSDFAAAGSRAASRARTRSKSSSRARSSAAFPRAGERARELRVVLDGDQRLEGAARSDGELRRESLLGLRFRLARVLLVELLDGGGVLARELLRIGVEPGDEEGGEERGRHGARIPRRP
jgi:hypothetical protein